jgi:ELWxxDGT repeat protein
MVAEINPGPNSANPSSLRVSGSKLFFAATDATAGHELWSSGGTAVDTNRVRDIVSGGSSSPSSLTDAGAFVYFAADHPTYGRELWKSDGTDGGTTLVKDVDALATSSSPRELVMVNSTLFFVADGMSPAELWVSNG